MLYRVQPYGAVTWTDTPQSLVDLVLAEEMDLDRLEWQTADQPAQIVLDMALRYGVPTSTGLAVGMRYPGQVARPAMLRDLYRQIREHRASAAYQAAEAQVNAVMGEDYAAYGRELDARIDESSARSIAEAEEEAAELYRAPLRQELVDHWTKLGGATPVDLRAT
ncbi:hypothetical protein NJC10_00220 [Micrococcus sp. M4NT]|uniref:hypothetical protein n=1 Tax=Micrococcus sp. M4NT TaxID=2957501 RepID=UPI0029B03E2A|nr:hypothetical protein [Micrococcus sp. M4NT]MDX2340106.1 hypothetical protein [Micrococcus sp. M4NT]